MSTDRPLRLVLVGWGAIARTTAKLLQPSGIEIVGVATRNPSSRPDLPAGAVQITDPASLAALQADAVAEAAGRESVEPWGRAALRAGADFIVSSVSAFADPSLLASIREVAEQNRAQIQIQPGALGGIDALAAARLMGIDSVTHRITKPPKAWSGTPAESLCSLDQIVEPTEFFHGSAAETATQFPKNANVAMTTALAGIGPERTHITLIADPDATTNSHEIRADGAFGAMQVVISNSPLPDNPKTSAMAALNLARSIENRTAALVI